MNVLELFAGSCIFSKEAKKLGYKTFTSDYKQFDGVDYVVDILDFDTSKVPFKPDLIWASPPCTSFSVAALWRHWNKLEPISDKAKLGVSMVKKTIDIIKEFDPKIWYIENPRGRLRSLDIVKGLPRTTIWYCQYGLDIAKPTDIWSNNIYNPMFNISGWKPKVECFNGNLDCHHQKTYRKDKKRNCKGVAGLGSPHKRAMLPIELCKEILKQTKYD
tara:strand:+ start:160 stop:810 length:651 start_codon:yes stop_codon:yes gene_type:complete